MSFILGWDCGEGHRAEVGFAKKTGKPCARGALVQDPKDEGHWLVVAPTGAGKTASFVIPQLLNHRGPIVAVDVKGELARTTARFRRTLGEVVIFDPFNVTGEGGSINPLGHIDPEGESLADDAYAVASLFGNPEPDYGSGSGRFWDDWAQDILAALVAHVLTAGDDTAPNLGAAYAMFHRKDADFVLYRMLEHREVHPFVMEKFDRYLALPEVTRGGVSASAAQIMRLLAGRGVQRSLARDTVDMELLTSGAPCTVYLVIPPDKLVSHAVLIKMVISSLIQRLMRRQHKPAHSTLFLVDEATQFGAVPSLLSSITLGRSYGIRTALLVQSVSQLRGAYGPLSEAILENCSLMTMGGSATFPMARQLAEQGFGDVSAETVFGLAPDEAMVRVRGAASRRLRKLNVFEDAMFAGKMDRNPLYQTAQQALVRRRYCGQEDRPPLQAAFSVGGQGPWGALAGLEGAQKPGPARRGRGKAPRGRGARDEITGKEIEVPSWLRYQWVGDDPRRDAPKSDAPSGDAPSGDA